MVKGLVGLVAKPTAGVLDFASQTSTGIKNTVRTFDDKANEQKQRYPRVFYGKECFFRSYIEHDSKILKDLFSISHGKYAKDHFVQSFLFKEQDKKEVLGVVLLTCEHIINFEGKKKKVRVSVEPGNIRAITQEEGSVAIELIEPKGEIERIYCIEPEVSADMIGSISNLRYTALAAQNLTLSN